MIQVVMSGNSKVLLKDLTFFKKRNKYNAITLISQLSTLTVAWKYGRSRASIQQFGN